MRTKVSLRRFGHWLVYLLVRVFISLIQAVSIETCLAAVHVLAYLAYDVVGLRRQIVDENLAHALPNHSPAERHAAARRMWRHLLIMVCEIAHAPRKIHDTNWQHYVSRTPRHRELVASLLMSRPRVLVTAHFGNFEVGGYLLGLLGLPSHTVARTLDNPYLDAYITGFRESQGQFILPKVGSAPQADGVLNSGGILVLLGDQHAGDRGCWVDFMGRPASCHKAVALFTLLSDAPMIVSYLKRRHRPMRFELGLADFIDPAVPSPALADVTTLTQWYNDALEREIRLAPEQYWWVHNRWRQNTKRRRRKKKVASPAEACLPAEQRPAA